MFFNKLVTLSVSQSSVCCWQKAALLDQGNAAWSILKEPPGNGQHWISAVTEGKFLPKENYWVGQKVHSGLSVPSSGEPQWNFWPNPTKLCIRSEGNHLSLLLGPTPSRSRGRRGAGKGEVESKERKKTHYLLPPKLALFSLLVPEPQARPQMGRNKC